MVLLLFAIFWLTSFTSPKSRFLLVSYLDDTHAIFLLYAQFLQGFAHDIHLLAILVKCGREGDRLGTM